MTVLNENGFLAKTLRPGVDGLTLINRAFTRRVGNVHSPLKVGELNQRILSLPISDSEKNRLMLDFAGHIVFVAKKDEF